MYKKSAWNFVENYANDNAKENERRRINLKDDGLVEPIYLLNWITVVEATDNNIRDLQRHRPGVKQFEKMAPHMNSNNHKENEDLYDGLGGT